MKFSKAKIQAKVHRIPILRFNPERKLTSYAGMIIFQALFTRLNVLNALRACCAHLKGFSLYGHSKMLLLLIVHLILGFRRLRGLDYYQDDPLVARVVGLRKLPDVATVSRMLRDCDETVVKNLQTLNRNLVLMRLKEQKLARVTIDFDGSVQSTNGHPEGSAVGFNKKKKGARSYYPLFATIAQLGQILDRRHRPGNVHDSNGALQFIAACLFWIRTACPWAKLESRVDSAFFSEPILNIMDSGGVEFSCSVPFERLPTLKQIIEQRQRWRRLDKNWSFFETDWKPNCWRRQYRLICLRQRKPVPHKGPLQLDLFEPRDFEYDYKVIVTNKTTSAKTVLLFHHGRGSQEKIFGEAKQSVALDYLPTRRLIGNQVFTLLGMLAHNLGRELQMQCYPPRRVSRAKRPALWNFDSLSTIRQHLLHKAGSLSRPQGKLTLTMNANDSVKMDIIDYLSMLDDAVDQ